MAEENENRVGWISLCNGDVVFDSEYDDLYAEACSLVNDGVDQGLIDELDAGGADESISIMVSDWIRRLEDAGVPIHEQFADSDRPGGSEIFYDIFVHDEEDHVRLLKVFKDYIAFVKNHLMENKNMSK